MNTYTGSYAMQLKSRQERIKYLRQKKGWRQQEIADRLNIPRGTYAHYESDDTREIPLVVLENLAHIFGTTVEFILAGRESNAAFVSIPADSDPVNEPPASYAQDQVRRLEAELEETKQLYELQIKHLRAKSESEKQELLAQIRLLNLRLGGSKGNAL